MVVMIEVKESGPVAVKRGGATNLGAGIVVGQKGRTVIITAAHVVQRAATSTITVEFRSRRDKPFVARVSNSTIDPELDLAVLYVDDPAVPKVLSKELTSSVSKAAPRALVGTSVTMVGYTSGEKWASNFTADRVTDAETTKIYAPSRFVAEGTSGGGMFDSQSSALVGMVVEDDQGRAVGRPIGLILERLKRWNIVELELNYDSQAAVLEAERELNRLGYSRTAPSLGQALASADAAALKQFAILEPSSALIGEALRTKIAKDETVAKHYFEAARSPEALAWLANVLARKTDPIDPNLGVPHILSGEEALINVAERATNVDAVIKLLDAGAPPGAFQPIRNWAIPDPRFLFPFSSIMNDERLDIRDKGRLFSAFLSHDGVVPRVTPRDEKAGAYFGAISADVEALQAKMQSAFGKTLTTTPDICARFPMTSCKRASDLYKQDWCGVVRLFPRLFGQFNAKADPNQFVTPFVVRYFLGADSRRAYFLVEELTYYSGYALLEVDRDLRQLQMFRFTSQHPLMDGPCVGSDSQYCWRKVELAWDARAKGYRSEYGVTLPVSTDCALANAQSRARDASIAPHEFTHPSPAVARCVNDILRSSRDKLADEATTFRTADHLTLGPRECVLANMNMTLATGNTQAMIQPHYVEKQAQQCCERILGYRR
jgi:hypothetical protein